MVRKITALLLVMAGFGILSCNTSVTGPNGVTYKTAVQYNDYIVNRQSSLMQDVRSFARAAQFDLDSASRMLDQFEVQADKMITDIQGMPPYKNDTALRQAAVNSFKFYKRVFKEDYKEIIRLRQEGEAGENGSADIDIEIRKIVDKLTKDEENYDKAFHNAQRNFADKNRMTLTDNPLNKKEDKLND